MSTDNPSLHHTHTRRIQERDRAGWEFVCTTCGYHARYITRARPHGQQLEILHIGDPQARHTSNHVPASFSNTQPVNVENEHVDETWLTPELRQQMEELLKDVDMGDWQS